MPLYRISRPANPTLAETLGTSSGIRGALVSAANPAAAIVIANVLATARGYNDVFLPSGWVRVPRDDGHVFHSKVGSHSTGSWAGLTGNQTA